ncbi:MAG: hypothetical protein Q4D82_01700 [Neisseria sp.]|nr:hypothetical protein [Neisseria sp.]
MNIFRKTAYTVTCHFQTALLFSATLLAYQSSAQTVYLCRHGNETVYTARPSENCVVSELPPLGRYRAENTGGGVTQTAKKPIAAEAGKTAPKTAAAKVKNTAKPVAEAAKPGSKARPADTKLQTVKQEINAEQAALAAAEGRLKTAKQQNDSSGISRLEAEIRDRRQTLRALRNEMARM